MELRKLNPWTGATNNLHLKERKVKQNNSIQTNISSKFHKTKDQLIFLPEFDNKSETKPNHKKRKKARTMWSRWACVMKRKFCCTALVGHLPISKAVFNSGKITQVSWPPIESPSTEYPSKSMLLRWTSALAFLYSSSSIARPIAVKKPEPPPPPPAFTAAFSLRAWIGGWWVMVGGNWRNWWKLSKFEVEGFSDIIWFVCFERERYCESKLEVWKWLLTI